MEISICNENQLEKTSQQETGFPPQLSQDWSGPQGAPDHCIRNFILLMIYFLYDQYDKCSREQSGLQPTLVKWGREEAGLLCYVSHEAEKQFGQTRACQQGDRSWVTDAKFVTPFPSTRGCVSSLCLHSSFLQQTRLSVKGECNNGKSFLPVSACL